MTWRFAVDEFGWNYTFDKTAGLNIRADNFFYTPIEVGANIIEYTGNYSTTYSETHYIKGDLRIVLITDSNRMGPIRDNLSIIKSGVDIKPTGYFGYYGGRTPLFTIDGNFINTVYYMTDVPEIRNPKPCRVNIETGKIDNNTSLDSIPPASTEQAEGTNYLASVSWVHESSDGKPIKTAVSFYSAEWPQKFSISDLSDIRLTKNGKEIKFSLSGSVTTDILRGSNPVQVGFLVELSKPLVDAGVYVMTGKYRGRAFTSMELAIE